MPTAFLEVGRFSSDRGRRRSSSAAATVVGAGNRCRRAKVLRRKVAHPVAALFEEGQAALPGEADPRRTRRRRGPAATGARRRVSCPRAHLLPGMALDAVAFEVLQRHRGLLHRLGAVSFLRVRSVLVGFGIVTVLLLLDRLLHFALKTPNGFSISLGSMPTAGSSASSCRLSCTAWVPLNRLNAST